MKVNHVPTIIDPAGIQLPTLRTSDALWIKTGKEKSIHMMAAQAEGMSRIMTHRGARDSHADGDLAMRQVSAG